MDPKISIVCYGQTFRNISWLNVCSEHGRVLVSERLQLNHDWSLPRNVTFSLLIYGPVPESGLQDQLCFLAHL